MKNISTKYVIAAIVCFMVGLAVIGISQQPAESSEDISASIEHSVRAFRVKKWFTSQVKGQANHQKAIYGPDNRKDIYALNDSNALEKMAIKAADSTCLLTSKSMLTKQADGTYLLTLQPYQQMGLEPCSVERFREQKTGGWCSGFLVKQDVVATAGHCCEARDEEAQQIGFVFKFYALSDVETKSAFSEEEVYFGKRILKHRLDNGGDYALIQLDRPVTAAGATPLTVRASGEAETRIGLIGYPSGLPAKAAFDATVRDRDSTWLYTNLDSYAGNSGSAVLNESGMVEGILVRGREDFAVHNRCFYSVRYPDSATGEVVTRASVFASEIPQP